MARTTTSDKQDKRNRSQVIGILTAYQRRVQKWFLLAAIVGAITGAGLALFNYLLDELAFRALFLSKNPWLYLFMPAVGLTVAWAIVRWLVPARSPATTEAYIENYHSPAKRLSVRDLPGRIAASFATIASGGSMGLEGPSVYYGATVGSFVQERFDKLFDHDDTKILEVAGAAAGIAAIFKAPLTGVMFALEAPYRDDLVRRALLPALTAAATGYLVYTIFEGQAPLFQTDRAFVTSYRELVLAVVLGVVCAMVARGFIYVMDAVKWVLSWIPDWLRGPLAGLAIGAMGVVTFSVVDGPLTLGPGLFGTQLLIGQQIAVGFLPFLIIMKMASTALTARGGGAGGMFFPLVFLGAGVGALFGEFIPTGDVPIYPVIGIAAMVGAGYRSPLAAVAFIAETTGSPGFVIPGLIAAAAAQFAMGTKSISAAQLSHGWSGVEKTLGKSVAKLIENRTRPPVIEASTDLETFARENLLAHRARALPVVEHGECVGVMPVGNLTRLDRDVWATCTVRDTMDPSPAQVSLNDTMGQVAEDLVQGDSDYAVVIDNGVPVGVLTATDVVELEEVLSAVSRRRPLQTP